MALRGVIAVALLTVAAVAIAAENSSSPSIPLAASTTVGAGAGVSAGAVTSGGEFKPAAVFDGDANDDDSHVKPLPKVDPNPPALKPTPQHCKHVIVGGGWSGTYFAWRTTVDSGAREAKDTCLFEALDRVGGRAYSKAGIPGMQDLRIDVGAYRFDRRNHIIVSHVARDVLHAPLRCYDQRPSDQDAVCNNYGSLDNFADAYGNNRGYASGPEGLTRKFEAHGGNVWFYHRLTKVAGGGSGGSMILTFAVTDPAGKTTTATVSCDTLFLNLSPPALRNLDPSSIVFTEASDDARAALEYPTEDPGAKQFLVYPATPWRAFPALREGLFANATVDPPLMGRFHDFYGKCPLNTEDGLDCWGAVLTYYDFDIKIVKEFAARYQKSKSDPYTYIPFEDQQHQDMIKRVHNNFLDQLDIQAEKHGVKGYNRTLVPYPSGTVIAVWWSHDNDPEASLLPAPSYLNPTKFPYEVDPNHAMRNLISRPLPKRELFIANEGFSGGNGWAEPALKMTERIVYAHVDNSQPSWVHDDCHDALTGWVNQSKALGGVEDCASVTWWNMFITNDHNTQLIPREADAGSHAGELPRMYTSRSTERWELDPGSDPVYRRSCPQEFAPEYLDASWGWCDESAVEFMLQIPATGWAGFGIGTDMTHADMVIAHRDEDGEVHVGHYYSSGYRPPTPVDPPAPYMLAMNATWAPGLGFTITFKRLADCNCSNGVNVSIDGTNTPFIYAGFNNGAGPPVRQHDFMYSNAADFGCGRTVAPTFSDDIKPLFRTKDREAMLWSLDLHDYDTMSNPHTFAEVYNVIELKTVHGLAQGMPPDATWSIAELHVFKQWADQGFKSGSTCPAKPPTFCGDVVQLFRPSDISEMQQYGLNLASYDDVKKYSTDILKRVRSGNMPCDEAGRWGQDKIKTFSDWIACGMIEGDGCTSLSDQDVFYMAINFAAQSPDQQQQIRAKLVEYLQQSRAQGQPGAVTNETKYRLYFDYTREAFEERLMQIYDQLEAEGAESDPATDPDFTSREKMLYRIRQLAPFNLIDGAWISNCCPTGPIDEVHSMMWGILNEEMGMGDVKHNHCDLYASLLHSVDIFLPDVRTRAFVDDPGFLPSAFTGSAYALALAAFTDDFFPELLGTTLQIEWCVLGLVPTAKLLEFWGIDPLFYNLHIAIDNADVGHGWRAKRAIEIYLDDVRAAQGEAAMQETFKRIWDGFLAFDALGTLGSDMMNHIHNMPTPRQKIMDMMGRKKKFGSRNHREKRLGSDHINDLFNDTEKFVYELENSAWVVPGNPEESPFLQHLIQFTGPMFRVFHEDDLQLWREWIMSLRPNVRQSGKLDIVDAMRHTIVRVMRTGMASEHHARIKIWGPSPTIKGEDVNQPVAVWAETVDLDPEYIMRALIDPRNELIVCGDATASPFYTHVMAPSNAMGAQFARVAADALPGLNDTHKGSLWTWREIVERWINDGCPFKAKPDETFSLFPTPHKDDWIISSRDESAFLDFYREHARRPRRDEGPRRGRTPRHHHHHHKKYKTGRHYVH